MSYVIIVTEKAGLDMGESLGDDVPGGYWYLPAGSRGPYCRGAGSTPKVPPDSKMYPLEKEREGFCLVCLSACW